MKIVEIYILIETETIIKNYLYFIIHIKIYFIYDAKIDLAKVRLNWKMA